MEEEFNPYAAPQSTAFAGPAGAKQTRLAHLGVESHLKALGVVWLWFGLWDLLALVIHVVMEGRGGLRSILTVIPPCLAGVGLCLLRRWAWILCLVLSGILVLMHLASFPSGLLGVITLPIVLRFLLREKTRRIMAEDYPGIIAATPELHSSVATWGWWVTGLLTLLAGVNYLRFFFGWW